MSEAKMGTTEMLAEVERLKAEARFPSLQAVLQAIAETRKEYVPKILAARAKGTRGKR
jgi:hypothetical protein